MSDYKPITGELRDAMCQWGWVERNGSIMFTTSPMLPSIDVEQSLTISGSDFDRLCDAIDAIHAQLERENAALKVELDRVLGEQEEAIQQALMGKGGVPATDENMAEHGWVKLPVDANGETIRLGDDMKTLLVGHEGEHSCVEWISLTEDGWEVDGEPPTSMCHYHAQTVEDVLREFALKVAGEECMTMRTGVVEEYAEKLREVMAE